jgi:hypothetical protein
VRVTRLEERYRRDQIKTVLFQAVELTTLRSAFNDPKFLFEHDGFRAIARISPGQCELVSRKGNVFRGFPGLCGNLALLRGSAVLDGEIAGLDSAGRSRFYELMRRRGVPVFYAFDCLSIDGKDLRGLPLLERKRRLKRPIRGMKNTPFAEHVEGSGESFLRLIWNRTWKAWWPSDAMEGMAWIGSKSGTPHMASTRPGESCSTSGGSGGLFCGKIKAEPSRNPQKADGRSCKTAHTDLRK